MKFLLDENLSHHHAARLRANGHDAIAVVEESLSGASDAAVRSAAIKSGRVLVTLDADFGNIRSLSSTRHARYSLAASASTERDEDRTSS